MPFARPKTAPLRASERRRPGPLAVGLTALAILISILFLLPILWLLASSFRSAAETYADSSPVSLWTIWPRRWTLDNVRSAIDSGFLVNLGNSVLVAGVTVIVGLLFSAMAGFALAVLPFKGRQTLFAVVVLSFLVPFEAIAIPLSRSFHSWGLANTYVALILPGLGNGLAVFSLRQFFLGVPYALAEAARVDGASWWRIFWSIYLPLCRPVLIGAGLMLFLFQWQAYMWPILVVSQDNLDLAPVSIAKAFGAFSTDYGRVFVETAVLALVPAAILLALQRHFVSSLASTGSKE
jgi:putative chitobiose transport system permease protein